MALSRAVDDDLPVAYGITMLILLFAEVVWLLRRPWADPRKPRDAAGQTGNQPDDTGSR